MKYNRGLKVDGKLTAKNIEIIKKNSVTSVEPWSELNQGYKTDLDADMLNGKHVEEFSRIGHTHNYLEIQHNNDKSAHQDIIQLIEKDENILGKPYIKYPKENEIFVGEIIASPIEYLTEKYNGVHSSTTWEISRTSNFNSMVFSSYNDSFNINSLIMGKYIEPNNIYYIRVKYNTKYFSTEWSDIVKFKSPESIVYAPTIIFSENFDYNNVKQNDTYTLNLEFDYKGPNIVYNKTNISMKKDNIMYNTTLNVFNDNLEISDIFDFERELKLTIYHITNLGKSLELSLNLKKVHDLDKISYEKKYTSSSIDYVAINSKSESVAYSNSSWSSGKGKVYLYLERNGCSFSYARWGRNYSWIESPNAYYWNNFGKTVNISNDKKHIYVSEPNIKQNSLYHVGRILTYMVYSNISYRNEFTLPNSISYSRLGNYFLDTSIDNLHMCVSVDRYIDKNENMQYSRAAAILSRSNIYNNWELDTIIGESDLAKFSGNLLYISKNSNSKSLKVYSNYKNQWELDETIEARFMESSNFAKSFDMNEKYLVIGAPEDNKYNRGLVYVYERKNNMWILFKKIYPDNDLYSNFGNNISISDDSTIFITTNTYNEGSNILIYSYNIDKFEWTFLTQINNDSSLTNNGQLIVSKDKSILVENIGNNKVHQYCLK